LEIETHRLDRDPRRIAMTLVSPQVHLDRSTPSFRPWWPWMLTAFAFPPAGFLGNVVAGRVDSPAAAATAGAVTGAIIGLVQWSVLRRRNVRLQWALATSVGLAAGLAAGAAAVSYRTDRPALIVMGALSGFAVGFAQASSTRVSLPRVATWASATAVLWAAGWIVSSGVIDAADQWPVFGISGALVIAFMQSLLVSPLLGAVALPNQARS
jgi:hypothetical protein